MKNFQYIFIIASIFLTNVYSEVEDRDTLNETIRAGSGVRDVLVMVRTNMCKVYQPTKTLKKCNIKTFKVEAALRNYACNCLPENFDSFPIKTNQVDLSWHMGKNGKPIDDIDAACTRLRDAYTCIVMDAVDEILDHPNPSTGELRDQCGRYTEFEYFIDTNKEIVCGPTNNPEFVNHLEDDEKCLKAVCEIERQFANEVFYLIGDDPLQFQADNLALGNYEIYDDATECRSQHNGYGANACCGDYPLRFPYVEFIKTCCNDGIAVLLGQCGQV